MNIYVYDLYQTYKLIHEAGSGRLPLLVLLSGLRSPPFALALLPPARGLCGSPPACHLLASLIYF